MTDVMQHASGETRKGERKASGIAELAKGKLYALQHTYPLDGRVSFYPASARGYSVANSYLLTQSDAARTLAPDRKADAKHHSVAKWNFSAANFECPKIYPRMDANFCSNRHFRAIWMKSVSPFSTMS